MKNTTMNTGAASLSDEQIRDIENDQAKMLGATRENLTVRTVRAALIAQHGFCTDEDHCTCSREIGYRICQPSGATTTPQADAAPIISGHEINDLFLKWSEWTTELGEAISRKNIDGFVSELRAAIAAGGAREAVGSEPKAETATLIFRGELVNVGIDESGIGDMELIVGTRGVLLSGLSQEETKALAPFLFQQVTLAVAANGEQGS
jgi:hypothetical protein